MSGEFFDWSHALVCCLERCDDFERFYATHRVDGSLRDSFSFLEAKTSFISGCAGSQRLVWCVCESTNVVL